MIELHIPAIEKIQEQLNRIERKLDQQNPPKAFWTVADMAEHLQCAPDTVRRMARQGQLEIAKRVGRRMLFRPVS